MKFLLFLYCTGEDFFKTCITTEPFRLLFCPEGFIYQYEVSILMLRRGGHSGLEVCPGIA